METQDIFGYITSQAVEVRRIYLGRRLYEQTGGVVQHGLLAGYRLAESITWREGDNAPKLLGLYEKEVCDLIARIRGDRRTLVDLGGADGWYAVGLLVTGHFEQSHCYELVEASRANMHQTATQAGVASRLHLYGAATSEFPAELHAHGVSFSDAIVLCDIEGAEFEVLTRECLEQLREAHLIVELHDFLVPNGGGAQAYQDLLTRASEFFHVSEIRAGARDLSTIPIVADHWTDSDRWLLCSEGRAKLMSWLHFSPKNEEAIGEPKP